MSYKLSVRSRAGQLSLRASINQTPVNPPVFCKEAYFLKQDLIEANQT